MVRRLRWPSLARWAAVVALALIVGLELGRQARPLPPAGGPATPAPTVRAQELRWMRPTPGNATSFWQAKAVALLQAKPQADGIPDARENLWARYRERVKEQ